MASLGAAILYLTARNLGWTRTIAEVCQSFSSESASSSSSSSLGNSTTEAYAIHIKQKHCSKAIQEIKTLFPEYAKAPSRVPAEESEGNFADHFVRKLQVPPVAEASIRVLFTHCREEQVKSDQTTGTKMSTLCAAITYFVCTMGSSMQRVAQQVHVADSRKRVIPDDKKREESKRTNKKQKTTEEKATNSTLELNDDEPFDAFTHSAVAVEDQSEKVEYEMRRMWDAWKEQMPWFRSLAEIEQSCGISRNTVMNLYKSDLYPRREELLNVLKDTVSKQIQEQKKDHTVSLRSTPLASILLAHITTAGAMMSDR
jgi:hypothetical protein